MPWSRRPAKYKDWVCQSAAPQIGMSNPFPVSRPARMTPDRPPGLIGHECAGRRPPPPPASFRSLLRARQPDTAAMFQPARCNLGTDFMRLFQRLQQMLKIDLAGMLRRGAVALHTLLE